MKARMALVGLVAALMAAGCKKREESCGWCPCGSQVQQGAMEDLVFKGMRRAQFCIKTTDEGRIVRHGPIKIFERDGRLYIEGQYTNGMPSGKWHRLPSPPFGVGEATIDIDDQGNMLTPRNDADTPLVMFAFQRY